MPEPEYISELSNIEATVLTIALWLVASGDPEAVFTNYSITGAMDELHLVRPGLLPNFRATRTGSSPAVRNELELMRTGGLISLSDNRNTWRALPGLHTLGEQAYEYTTNTIRRLAEDGAAFIRERL